MPYRCPSCQGEVDLARTPLHSGLVRLAVLGARDFALDFDDAAVHDAAGALLGPCPHDSQPAWDLAALEPVAAAGWDALLAAAPESERLATLAAVWRPRALVLAGRAGERSAQDALRDRLAVRLDELAERIGAARLAGDDDEAQRLHARYIELGTVYAGRMAAEWRG